MKHINLSELWKFSLEPFPAFRCDVKLGIRRQREEFALLPVLGGLIPGRHYVVYDFGKLKNYPELLEKIPPIREDGEKCIYYDGRNPVEAEEVAKKYREITGMSTLSVKDKHETFSPGIFKVIKSKKKGTWLVVHDNNSPEIANDLLLFQDFNVYYGDISIVNKSEGCIRIASADSVKAKQKKMAIAMLMKPGSWFAAEFSGRHGNRVEKYVWDGEEILKETFSTSEWNPPESTRTWKWAWELGYAPKPEKTQK